MDFMKLTIDPGFKKLIAPLRSEEFDQLKANLLDDGCRDPISVWPCISGDPPSEVQELIILDGHNRYQVCQEYGISFKVTEIYLKTYEDAEDWIDRNQLGRRNLSPSQYEILLGRRYNRTKNQGKRTDLTSDQNDHKSETTAERLAKEHGVSPITVRRAGQFVDAIEIIKDIDPEIETKVISGQAPSKSLIVEVANDIKQAKENLKQAKTESYANSYISEPPRKVKEAADLLENKIVGLNS
jgi:hypothetical protein